MCVCVAFGSLRAVRVEAMAAGSEDGPLFLFVLPVSPLFFTSPSRCLLLIPVLVHSAQLDRYLEYYLKIKVVSVLFICFGKCDMLRNGKLQQHAEKCLDLPHFFIPVLPTRGK